MPRLSRSRPVLVPFFPSLCQDTPRFSADCAPIYPFLPRSRPDWATTNPIGPRLRHVLAPTQSVFYYVRAPTYKYRRFALFLIRRFVILQSSVPAFCEISTYFNISSCLVVERPENFPRSHPFWPRSIRLCHDWAPTEPRPSRFGYVITAFEPRFFKSGRVSRLSSAALDNRLTSSRPSRSPSSCYDYISFQEDPAPFSPIMPRLYSRFPNFLGREGRGSVWCPVW